MDMLEETAQTTRVISRLGSLDATHLVSLFGFSCYLIWEFLGVFEVLPFLSGFHAYENIPILRPIMFCALFLGFALVFHSARKLAHLSRAFLVMGAVSALSPLVIALFGLMFGGLPLWLAMLAWAMYGLSLAFLMFLWAIHFEGACDPKTPLVVVASYAIGFVVFLLLSLANAAQETYLFIGLLLVVGTLATAAFLGRERDDRFDAEGIEATEFSLAKVIHSGAYGVIYGFVLTFLLSLGEASAFVGALGGLAGCVIAWFMFKKNALLNNTYLRRVTFMPVVVAVLFLPIGGSWSYILCSFLVINACICTAIASWIIASREVSEQRSDPVALFYFIKTPGWFGFFIGTLVGGVMLVFAPDSFPLTATLLAALICVSFSVFEMQPREESGGVETDEEAVLPKKESARFQQRCTDIIAEHGLSPREAEVFMLLAKGRNAEHISQALCIARPTAKTHIQHIYQKLGINSHQELIDLLEVSAAP